MSKRPAWGVLLTQPAYELWRDASVPSGEDYGTMNEGALAGNFIVIRRQVAFLGAGPGGVALRFRGPNGGNLTSDYSVIDGTVFGDSKIQRGSAFLLWSDAHVGDPDAPEADIPSLSLENLSLETGMVASKNRAWPASVSDPIAFDISNKGIFARASYQIGAIRLVNCRITGFLGECVYTGNSERCSLFVRNLYTADSNAQPINPSTISWLDVDGLRAERMGVCLEGWTGPNGGRLVNASFKDCGEGGLFGGGPGLAALDGEGRQPLFQIDAMLQDCTAFHVGSYTTGRLKLIDTKLMVYENPANSEIVDVDLDVTSVCHADHLDCAVQFSARPESAPQSISNVNIRLNAVRSRYAKANGKFFLKLALQQGSLGPNCVVAVRSSDFLNGSLVDTFDLASVSDYSGGTSWRACGHARPVPRSPSRRLRSGQKAGRTRSPCRVAVRTWSCRSRRLRTAWRGSRSLQCARVPTK